MASPRAETLRRHFETSPGRMRPILTLLNGDNSWLMSFPFPAAERAKTGKAYYHVVSDPWLEGPAVTLHSWFAWIALRTAPAIGNAAAVEALVKEIEDAAAAAGVLEQRHRSQGHAGSPVDAIFVSIKITDHMHEPTLRTFNPTIPVFASPDSAPTINSWKHFDTVVVQQDMKPGSGLWQDLHPGTLLPTWLTVFRLEGHFALNFASAIVWTDGSTGKHEAILSSPHGIYVDQPTVQTFLGQADPPIYNLAVMGALKDSFTFGIRMTLGVAGCLALVRASKPKYWIHTAHGDLHYWGLFLQAVRDVVRSVASGLADERASKGDSADELEPIPDLTEVPNGGCLVLE
ncbi:hypothetical protein F4778DRAFT_745307 [Xylariomycetidae sp. FL2044]|nr:hypothetical protein F4778DRAFT_745307 [Xylariomycetidae sp. FL2044]